MNDLEDLKEELSNLMISGRKEDAIKFLQEKYGADREEAERLLGLALKEHVTPARFFSSVLRSVPERMGGGKGCKQTIFRFIAISLGFIGIPPLLIAMGVYLYNDYQINSSDIVKGTVVELRPYEQYGEPTSYTPILSYEINGEAYSIEAPVYSDTPEFSIGETVELYVNKVDPNDAIINTFTQLWFMIILVGSIGCFFTMGMIVFIFLGRTSN